jgi:hypothetical protein
MFGTHNIALSGNDIYTISSPNFKYQKIGLKLFKLKYTTEKTIEL